MDELMLRLFLRYNGKRTTGKQFLQSFFEQLAAGLPRRELPRLNCCATKEFVLRKRREPQFGPLRINHPSVIKGTIWEDSNNLLFVRINTHILDDICLLLCRCGSKAHLAKQFRVNDYQVLSCAYISVRLLE
ncbi:hypothetical protein D918_06312 [Trichuris suis]|nr:hypothetical protein D918_06312 [Trichuris suis]